MLVGVYGHRKVEEPVGVVLLYCQPVDQELAKSYVKFVYPRRTKKALNFDSDLPLSLLGSE